MYFMDKDKQGPARCYRNSRIFSTPASREIDAIDNGRRIDNRDMAEGQRPLKTLERVLSKAGLGSRTEARGWIGAGRVKVNGRIQRDPDHWVDLERDRVDFDGK